LNKSISYIIFFVFIFFEFSCGGGGFHKNFHRVIEIIDGNSIRVRNGVTIHLIGIENTKDSYRYLKRNILNEKIRIKYDSKKRSHVNNKHDEVYAYVIYKKKSINGEILRLKLTGINNQFLNDSIVDFENYYYGENKQKINNLIPAANTEYRRDDSRIMSLQDLVKQTESSVFLVITYNENDEAIATGTGFFIDKEGVAVSNYHVFKGGSRWRIKTKEERYYDINDVLDYDREKDFIIFKVDDIINTPSLKLSNSLPGKGEDIFVLGNPHGLESTLTKGVVSAIRSWYSKNDFIQIDAPISSGSSGSPVINMKGEVVGVATLKIKEDCESCNFAISIDLVKRKLKKY